MNIILTDFKIEHPQYEECQERAVTWLAQAHAMAESQKSGSGFNHENFLGSITSLIKRYGCHPNSIGKRASELIDFTHLQWSQMRIFNLVKNPQGAKMDERMLYFSETVDKIFDKFYPDRQIHPPTDLIHVTCTGYVSPSGAQKIVSKRGWNALTSVYHVYHMGCYAAHPAIKIASGLLTSTLVSNAHPTKRVDLVHTELCTLHFNPSLHSPEQLVVQSLFADGLIKYSAVAEESLPSTNHSGLQVLGVREEIIPDSLEAMTWICSDWGMKMTLSKNVPKIIAECIEQFLMVLFEEAGINDQIERTHTMFAIHPGGPKIIDEVQKILKLTDEQLSASRKILFECGNMSSATLPHIWHNLLVNSSIPSGTIIVSLAFGPGLTISGCLLRKL